jgi:hypothetical protein
VPVTLQKVSLSYEQKQINILLTEKKTLLANKNEIPNFTQLNA